MIDEPLTARAGAVLRLRTLTPDDAPEFARHVAADQAHLREHLSWGATTHVVDGARDWLLRYHERRDGRVVAAGAFAGERLVGGALLVGHEPDGMAVEVGCWVTTPVEGRGVAGAASAAMIAHARRALAAERVVWRCTTVNRARARSPSGSASSTRAPSAARTCCTGSATTSTSSRSSAPSSIRSWEADAIEAWEARHRLG